jgi:hypothetical protein
MTDLAHVGKVTQKVLQLPWLFQTGYGFAFVSASNSFWACR